MWISSMSERRFICSICRAVVPESELRDELVGHSPAAESIEDVYEFFERLDEEPAEDE